MSRLKLWSGHPPGLATLFFTEFAERASFYGMKALLIYYLMDQVAGGLAIPEDQSKLIVGTYVGLVYLLTSVGGKLADNFLGNRVSILVGGLLMAFGHFAMAFNELFFHGIALLILGNGFFKPCVSTMLGSLYKKGDDVKKAQAYGLFYMSINIGAMLSPILCGWLQEEFGWHYGFGAAGIIMVASVVWFVSRLSTIEGLGLPPGRDAVQIPRLTSGDWSRVTWLTIGGLVLVMVSQWALPVLKHLWFPILIFGERSMTAEMEVVNLFVWRLPLVALALWAMNRFLPNQDKAVKKKKLTDQQKKNIGIIVFATVAMFFCILALEQSPASLALFVEQHTDLDLFGWSIPPSWFQSVNPVFILLLIPLYNRFWETNRGRRFTAVQKQTLGIFFFILCALTMMFAEAQVSDTGDRVSKIWVILAWLFITLGEVPISALGLAAVEKFAPAHMKNMLMGVFFLGVFAAGNIAAPLETVAESWGFGLWPFLLVVWIVALLVWIWLSAHTKSWEIVEDEA